MLTGNWKQEEARKRFKDVSREALDRMDGKLEELANEPTGERQAAEGLPSSAAAAAPLPLWPTATSPVPGESVPSGEGLEGEFSPLPAAEEAESGASRTPPPTDDPADEEEESAVESGRYGELRNALSGKSAALEDKAWDQIIVWNREPPPEDVYAVVHYRVEDSEMDELAYWHKSRGVWSMDRNGAYALEADVLGWFRVPKWEG